MCLCLFALKIDGLIPRKHSYGENFKILCRLQLTTFKNCTIYIQCIALLFSNLKSCGKVTENLKTVRAKTNREKNIVFNK